MYKARALAAAPLRAYGGSTDHPDLLPNDHPLAHLCARPNPYQSGIELIQSADVSLNLSGNAYFYVERGNSNGALGIPKALWCLRPDRVMVVPGQDGDLKGYLYTPEGVSWDAAKLLLPQDIIHIRLPNPGDPLEGLGYGLSPVSALARSADVDNRVTEFLKAFFDRGANPNLTVAFEGSLSDYDLARAREEFAAIYGGSDRWTRPVVLDSGAKVQRMSLTFDEMGFGELDERNESRILGPFGVPPILIGSRLGLLRSTYANYEEARRAFWQDTFVPELTLFVVDFQHALSGIDGSFPSFDFSNVPALQRDIPAMVDAASKLWAMGVPANQALEAVGLSIGDVPGGDVGYLPLNLMPVASAVAKPEPQGAPSGEPGAEGKSADPLVAAASRSRPKSGSGVRLTTWR